MITGKYLSLALLLLLVAGLAWGKSDHHSSRDSVEESDSNNLRVKSSFYMSMPLFLRNAIDSLTSTTRAPSSMPTQRPCEVTSCLNNGTLLAGQNGSSCPTCDCAPGCSGSMCETCTPVSTTPMPTTKYNCNTLSCMNGGTVWNLGNGSCSCRCSASYYTGDFCELRRECGYNYGLTCNNGGTPSYHSNSGCMCKCPPCYYGTSCDYYDQSYCSTNSYTTKPPCSMLGCYAGQVVYPNSTDCRCGCNPGYSGEHCDVYNTCRDQIWCGNGRVYYDPAWRACQCACPPGFYGTNCAYTIN